MGLFSQIQAIPSPYGLASSGTMGKTSITGENSYWRIWTSNHRGELLSVANNGRFTGDVWRWTNHGNAGSAAVPSSGISAINLEMNGTWDIAYFIGMDNCLHEYAIQSTIRGSTWTSIRAPRFSLMDTTMLVGQPLAAVVGSVSRTPSIFVGTIDATGKFLVARHSFGINASWSWMQISLPSRILLRPDSPLVALRNRNFVQFFAVNQEDRLVMISFDLQSNSQTAIQLSPVGCKTLAIAQNLGLDLLCGTTIASPINPLEVQSSIIAGRAFNALDPADWTWETINVPSFLSFSSTPPAVTLLTRQTAFFGETEGFLASNDGRLFQLSRSSSGLLTTLTSLGRSPEGSLLTDRQSLLAVPTSGETTVFWIGKLNDNVAYLYANQGQHWLALGAGPGMNTPIKGAPRAEVAMAEHQGKLIVAAIVRPTEITTDPLPYIDVFWSDTDGITWSDPIRLDPSRAMGNYHADPTVFFTNDGVAYVVAGAWQEEECHGAASDENVYFVKLWKEGEVLKTSAPIPFSRLVWMPTGTFMTWYSMDHPWAVFDHNTNRIHVIWVARVAHNGQEVTRLMAANFLAGWAPPEYATGLEVQGIPFATIDVAGNVSSYYGDAICRLDSSFSFCEGIFPVFAQVDLRPFVFPSNYSPWFAKQLATGALVRTTQVPTIKGSQMWPNRIYYFFKKEQMNEGILFSDLYFSILEFIPLVGWQYSPPVLVVGGEFDRTGFEINLAHNGVREYIFLSWYRWEHCADASGDFSINCFRRQYSYSEDGLHFSSPIDLQSRPSDPLITPIHCGDWSDGFGTYFLGDYQESVSNRGIHAHSIWVESPIGATSPLPYEQIGELAHIMISPSLEP